MIMKMFIGNQLIGKLKPDIKSYDIWDSKLTGFILRVLPSGTMVYRCEYARGKRVTLGKVGVLTPAQARDRAREILADVVKGNNPANRRNKTYTLKEFIEKEYAPWRRVNRKRADEDIYRLKARFGSDFGNESLACISPLLLDRWRSKRVAAGIKPITVNRDIAILKALLSKAEEWGIVETNPLAKFKPISVDSSPKVRYLTKSEEVKLKQALAQRDEDLKAARDRGNKWKNARGYDLLPDLYQFAFADHMTAMILLSINTGLRRGELFGLSWENINFSRAILTVQGDTAKSGKTRHVPLNSVALQVLQAWRVQCQQGKFVFSSNNGNPFNNVKKAWAGILVDAEIQSFRWHDMHHHFASKLVMAGVDLNTVRELLGHADIKMTLRYAHLAPEHKAKAVAKLLDNEEISISSVA
jgi:integrase